jgi:hypothetical protein
MSERRTIALPAIFIPLVKAPKPSIKFVVCDYLAHTVARPHVASSA